jgi:hypothetical protein
MTHLVTGTYRTHHKRQLHLRRTAAAGRQTVFGTLERHQPVGPRADHPFGRSLSGLASQPAFVQIGGDARFGEASR